MHLVDVVCCHGNTILPTCHITPTLLTLLPTPPPHKTPHPLTVLPTSPHITPHPPLTLLPTPRPHITPPSPLRWCWLFYINPNFYGFSSSAFILLSTFDSESSCGSELECYLSSGKYIIEQFSFGEINPYLNIVVSINGTWVFNCHS